MMEDEFFLSEEAPFNPDEEDTSLVERGEL